MSLSASKGRPLSTLLRAVLSTFLLLSTISARAQASLPLNVQGRVTVDGLAYNGVGKFKFALVIATGRSLLWTSDGSTPGGNFEPTASLDINVVKGVYSVLLGDTTIPGMNAINPDVFINSDVRLRIWFNDGNHGFQQLTPDQRVAAVGYAFNTEHANKAAVLTGNVTIQQLPSSLVTNNATEVSLTGAFTGDGSGLVGIRGSTPFQIANADTNNAVANTGYLITNITERVVLLPLTDSMRVGDIVRVAGPGSWKITQRADQAIFASHFRGGVGATWVGRETVRNWTGIASSTNGMNLAAVVYGRFIYLSTNSGVTWAPPPVSPSKNWLSIASSADGQRLIAGPDTDVLYISSDFGQGWSGRALPGSRVWTGVASSYDGTNLVAVSSGPIFTSLDGGDTWVQRANAGQRNWTGVATSADGTNIIAASATGLARSIDKGTNWTAVLSGSFAAVACSADGQRGFAAAQPGSIYTSNDGGATWLKRDASGSHTFRNITCSADGSIIAATSPDGISVSVDGGGSWTIRGGARDWRGIASSADGLQFAATVFNGLIYTSDAVTFRTTTAGVAGYLAGGEYSAVELQHAGNGRFFPLSSSGQIYAY